ncbi:uncharacterized protein LOC101854778 [Aplysia californica]|uniref:Uncharacterized protein LOC101854778 n=1 Tax=Aplysia californica TaxID=6500 RepID=A0ABM0JFP9_APLCA|nr:uncharacterized protein LOC101854778 [Aplysia californica]
MEPPRTRSMTQPAPPPSLNSLPTELLELIFCNTDGVSFIRLRSMCKRFKAIIDNIENSSNPSIWIKLLEKEFVPECLETVACTKYWRQILPFALKTMFVQLKESVGLVQCRSWFTLYVLRNMHVHLTEDICFVDGAMKIADQLKGHKILRIKGFPAESWPPMVYFTSNNINGEAVNKLCYAASLRTTEVGHISTGASVAGRVLGSQYFCHIENEVVNITLDAHVQCSWNHFKAFFGRSFKGQDKLLLWDSWEQDKSVYSRAIDFPDSTVVNMAMSENWLVAVNSSYRLVFATAITNFKENYNPDNEPLDVVLPKIYACYQLRSCVQKMVLRGSLLIILTDDGLIRITDISKNKEGKPVFSDFHQLVLKGSSLQPTRANTSFYHNRVRDFTFYGPLFAAVSEGGLVYVSFLEKCTVQSFQEHASQSMLIDAPTMGTTTKVTMDYCGGLTLALLERYIDNLQWSSAVHVIYVHKAVLP